MAGVAGDLRRHATVFCWYLARFAVYALLFALCRLRDGLLELMLAAFDAVDLFGDKNTKQ